MEALSGASADIPFTDMTLLSVSVAGFCVLAVTIYKIILAKTGNATSTHNGRDDNDTEQLTMEERLLRADVSTLNRAQRRARAKAIMKEQRRGVVPSHLENNNNNNNNNIDADLAVFDEGDPAVAGVVAPPVGLLSRRERHAAAKATERHERMQCHGERQRQQDEAEQRAQQLKQERIQQERWIMERQRFAEEQHQEQLQTQWRDLFSVEQATKDRHQQSVKDFVAARTNSNRIVQLDSVAMDFGVSVETVSARLQQVVKERRLAGYFTEHGHTFVAVSTQELQQMADTIEARGSVTMSEVATLCEIILNSNGINPQLNMRGESLTVDESTGA